MISSFQLGLIVLGVAVVAAVVIYNRWVASRLQPRRARPASPDGAEVRTMDADVVAQALDDRLEPVLRDDAVTGETSPVASGSRPPLTASASLPLLDTQLDALVQLTADTVVSGDAVLAALPGTRRIGSKPFFIEGQNQETQDWEFPRAGQRYASLRAGIQLANRMGALNEIEFSEFVVKLQAFADTLQLGADFPDMMQEVARARELDQFASAHDAQLSFTLRASRAAWSPGYLTQHAARQGFVAGALPGRMVLPAAQPGAAPVLVLQFETQAALSEDPDQAALRDFSITLDVPHVARAERPFVRMREAALALAASMEGSVTDDGGQSLGKDAMDRIGADLEILYDALEARHLPAGAALTRRLFS